MTTIIGLPSPEDSDVDAPVVSEVEFEGFAGDMDLTGLPVLSTLALAQERIEHYCRVAFTPRRAEETLTADNGYALTTWPRVIEVETVDEEETGTGPFADGRVPLTDGEHAVVYVHGYPEPPLAIKRAVCLLARHYLIEDPTDIDYRATHKTTEMASWSLITPGVRGAIFPIPEVNEIVSTYRYIAIT
jgi:hypothetical protein